MAFCVFAAVATVTPGPNNVMALASGVRVGVRRSMPLVLGINCGVALMMLAVGLGLGSVIQAAPGAQTFIKWAGAAYLLLLAWRIANAGPISTENAKAPLGFFGAVGFQWINPKAWALTTGAVAAYAPPGDAMMTIALMALSLALIGFPCVSLWAAFGHRLRLWLMDEQRNRWFNRAMAIALAASLYPIFAN